MCMYDAGKRTLRDFRLQKRKLLYVFKAFFMVLLHLISLLRYFSSGVYFFFLSPALIMILTNLALFSLLYKFCRYHLFNSYNSYQIIATFLSD